VLLRRILAEHLSIHDVVVARPFRVPRNRVVKQGELERAITQAQRDRAAAGSVLVILDADDDCPVELSHTLLERAERATALPVAVVIATREFEAWFLGAKESLRGRRGIRDDAKPPADVESIRGAKERVSSNMVDRRYLAVDDQPALAAVMRLEAASANCRSFRKLLREVGRLGRQMTDRPPE
jgi:hypothetical protein